MRPRQGERGSDPGSDPVAATNCPSVRPASDCTHRVIGSGFVISAAPGSVRLSRIEAPIPPLPADREARAQALAEALEERILVLDGATVTMLQSYELGA